MIKPEAVWLLARWSVSASICILLAGVATAAEKSATKPDQAGTRVVMDSIFNPLTELLPLSFDAAEFESTANRKKIEAALKALSDNASRLKDHSRSRDRAFEFVAASLARDARDIYRWYRRGSYNESRYLLHNLTENCIACHSRLPESVKFPAAQQFFKQVKMDKLSLVEQAQLLMATRQFDEALATYERMFTAETAKPSEFVMMDSFTDYLKLCLRVKEDLNRPIPVLEKLAARKDLPKFISLEVAQWLRDLKQYASNPPVAKDDLATGRSLISAAQGRMQFRMDRAGLIEYILASKYLNRFVTAQAATRHSGPKSAGGAASGGQVDDAQLAEAYYLLGVAESMIGRSYWLSQTEFYLETAVRLAPQSAMAEKAFALLEEQTILEYSGSAGTNIPEDVQRTLDELRKLMRSTN